MPPAAELPTFERIRDGYRFLALRHGYSGELNETGIRAALTDARALAQRAEDEPAAVFFALAARAKSLAGSWRTLPALVAINMAAERGHRIRASRDDYSALLVPIASRTMNFDEVRAWFATRFEPTT